MKKLFNLLGLLALLFFGFCRADNPVIAKSQETRKVKKHKTFKIRCATAKDFPACTKLAQQVYDTIYKSFLDENHFRKAYEKINRSIFEPFVSHKMGQLFVAENEHRKIVGCVQVCPFFIPQASDTWEIVLNLDVSTLTQRCDGSAVFMSRFYVDESCRGQGIGKKLLKRVKLYSKSAKKIYLTSYLANKSSVDLYNHLGFRDINHLCIGGKDEHIVFSIDVDCLS